MRKLEADDPETRSADPVAENLEQLKALFPEAFSEGKIDFEVLKQLLGGAVEEREEKYGLNWHGKRRARQLALTPSTGTLRPCPEESVDWETTKNIFIEGDNLEVLKLLQKSYAGKVKLIYIDPPYNTGKDFVYKDDYRDNIKNYLELTGQVEDGRRISTNLQSGGRFHTGWLNMIYPRLRLAWDCLRQDGFLLVSIDDHELAHLRSVLDELCGEENFIATLVYDRNRKNDAKLVSSGHEYMVLFAKNKQLLTELEVQLRAPKEGVDELRDVFEDLRRRYADDWHAISVGLKEHYATFVEDDPRLPLARFTKVGERGPFREDGDASWPGGGGPRYDVPHPVTGRPCSVPSRGWVYATYDRMKQEIDAGNVVFGPDETRIPSLRRYLFERDEQVLRSVIFSYAQKASQDFAALFEGLHVFQNPKSYRDLQSLVTYLTSPGDIVLDFFAGSGTTGHGTMLANVGAQLPRRFVLVQFPEPLDPAQEEQRIGATFCDSIGRPRSIAELTKERLRRAGRSIRMQNVSLEGDLGFRSFRLDSSNIREWEGGRQRLAEEIQDSIVNLKADRSEADILYEVLLKLGLDLCVPIEKRVLAGKEVHSVGSGVLFACFSTEIRRAEVEDLGLGIVRWIQELEPAGDVTCVFRDSAFEDDVAKTNLAAILEQHGVQKVRSL